MAKKAAPKKRIIKGRDYNTDKRSDGLRQAKRKGWRITNSNRVPTKKEIQDFYDGKRTDLYMENRVERSDFSTRAKKGERFEKGGSIDSSMRFTGNDYDKLIDSGKFEGVKNGNLYELKEIDSSKVIGKFNESKEILFIAGKKDLSNALVVWLKDNSHVSSDNVDKLAKGGFVGKGELVWKKLDNAKKAEFLKENFTPEITPRTQETLVGKAYNFLPSKVKIVLNAKYANVEEYDKGGEVNDSDIKELSNGYKEAILFTGYDEDEVELDSNYSISDFDSKANEAIEKMAKQYIVDNKEAIEESGLDYGTIGRDIWYTQAGHGVGFFDEELDKDVEDKLTKGAKKFGDLSHNVFAQDGKVYLEGMKFAKGGEVKNKKVDKVKALLIKNKVETDDVSPNFVNDFAHENGITDLTSQEVVEISDTYEYVKSNKFAKGGKIDRTKSTKKTRVNRTKKAIAQDKNIKALHGGKRISESGSVYYENRENRKDDNRTKKLAKGGDLKKYTSADLPKDGSEIKIHMPEMGKFPAEDIVLKYNQDNFAFDAYRNGELSGTRITEKQVLDNLNNGSYEFKNDSNFKYKKGDVVYVYQYHSDPRNSSTDSIRNDKEEIDKYLGIDKKYIVGKKPSQQKWSKVEILEPWSEEKGWESYKVKQLDGYRKENEFVANQSQMSKTNNGTIAIGYMEEGGEVEEFAKGGKVKLREIEDETVLMPYVIAEPIAETAAEITLKDEFSKWESLSKSEKEALDEKYKNLVDEISVYLVKRANTVYTHNKSFEKDVKGKKGREVLNTFMEHWCGLVDGKLVKPISDTMARYEKESKSASFEDGGEVSFENKYEGHSTEEVWNGWNESQRSHFLLDHSELLDNDRIENNLGHSRTVQKDKNYSELTPHTKRVLESHVEKGQYKKGGEIVKFEKLKFNSHKNHNPKTDILEGHIDGDSFITYGIDVNGDKKGTEHMEYYKGSNFVVGSKKPSSSRHYTKEAIPTKWKASWEELKKEYEEKYSKEEFEKGGDLGSYVSEDKKFNDYKKTLEEKYGKGFSNKSLSEEEFEKLYELKERRSNSYEKNIPIEDARNPKMEKGGEIKSELTLSEIESKLGKTFSFWSVPYEVNVDGATYRKEYMGKNYKKI